LISGRKPKQKIGYRTYLNLPIFIILLLPYLLFPQTSVKLVYADKSPLIDGQLSASEWLTAAMVDSFTQREPNSGKPVSERTEFYICYDAENLYIAARCYDDPALIAAQQLERDASLANDDKIVIILDTFLDRRNAYWFQVNALGCVGDGLLSQNGASLNKDWDGLWVGKSNIHEAGWDVEVKIPFKSLAFNPDLDHWGFKLEREIQRISEKSYWPIANVNSYKFQVSDAGLLVGLTAIVQGIGLDIRPYGLLGFDQKEHEKNNFSGEAGLDVFYQITPAIKSALTINTDFAQTEVDDKQINLTRFPLFFPEKRDFFLDGASFFQFGREGDENNKYANRLIVFFSRQLGLDYNRNPIPILGGLKITGKEGEWNIGVMDVVDEREEGARNFTVARISRNFGSQSMIGLIGTLGNARSSIHNYVVGLDLKLGTSTFQGNKNLSLLLYGLKSETERISGNDYSFGAEINYPNDLLSFRGGFNQIEKYFDAGIGFVPRKEIRNTYLEGGISPRPQKWGILQLQFLASLDYITNLSNQLLTREISFQPMGIRLESGDQLNIQLSNHYDYLSENETISSIPLPEGTYRFWQSGVQLSTAQRRDLWFLLSYNWGGFYNGQRQTTVIQSGYKIFIPLFIGSDLEYTQGTLSKVDFTRKVYRLRVNVLFSPEVTLNNFVQYDNYSKQTGWQSRFRWILSPGNELNLVWNSIVQDTFERFTISESAVRIKFQYNYRF
jgi:hypothetical protein